MEIEIDKAPRCIWHTDCSENKHNSGIVREMRDNYAERKTLVRCLHCGAEGFIPYDTSFGVRICIEDA